MKIYYLFYTILLIYSFSISQNNRIEQKKQNRNVCILGFGMLFVLLALRHTSMGIDLYKRNSDSGYLPSFKELNTYTWKKVLMLKEYINYEKGYIIFNKLIGSIYNHEQFFLGACAFVSFLPIAVYIYKRSKIPLLSICVFVGLPVFLMYFSGIRQCIAIGLTVVSMFFIEKKLKIPFILTVLLAAQFHYTSIIFLVAYPLYYVRLQTLTKLIFVTLLPIIFIIRRPLFSVLSKLFKDDAETAATGAGTLFIVFCLIYLFLIFFNDSEDRKQNGLINLCYVACVCQAFSGIYQLAMRVGYYFMIYMIISIPNTISNMKDKGVSEKREYILSYMILLFFFVIYGLSAISKSTWAMANPYYFFWQEVNI